MTWAYKTHEGGGYSIFDSDGRLVHKSATSEVAINLHVMALQEVHDLREELSALRKESRDRRISDWIGRHRS